MYDSSIEIPREALMRVVASESTAICVPGWRDSIEYMHKRLVPLGCG